MATAGSKIPWKRVVLKLSGEALMGPLSHGLHQPTLERIARDIRDAASLGVDGLGEVPADDADALPYPPASSEAPAVAPGGDDAAAALDEARARLRQRADDLARRMEQGDA